MKSMTIIRRPLTSLFSLAVQMIITLFVLLLVSNEVKSRTDCLSENDDIISVSNLKLIKNRNCHGSHTQIPTIPVKARINCFPETEGSSDWQSLTEENCTKRGCTYDTDTKGIHHAPICYMHPADIGYQVVDRKANTQEGYSHYIELDPLSQNNTFNLLRVRFTVKFLSDNHVQFKFEDRDDPTRYQVPFSSPTFPSSSSTSNANTAKLALGFREKPFSFKIIRRSTGAVLFDTSMGGFVFSDKFLQLSTRLATDNFYGLGEHEHPSFKHDLNYKGNLALLSGVHPMYMILENDGKAHGVFLMNSNAMEFSLIPEPGVIIRTTGGVFDFHLYTGPTPENVVQQHAMFVGLPYLPPYWSLGFHLGQRYGNLSKAMDLFEDNIPIDVIYFGNEYMNDSKDFTLDLINFNLGEESNWVNEKRKSNELHSVLVLDAAIVTDDYSYEPWQSLRESKAFIKWQNGSDFIGQGSKGANVSYPDFLLDRTVESWEKLIVTFSKMGQFNETHLGLFDGLYLDVNEPRNYGKDNCPPGDYEDPPPSVSAVVTIVERLSNNTLCMTLRQNDTQFRHYDVHNLYGLLQSKATVSGVKAARPQKRPFVMSLSTFPGSGHYVSHSINIKVKANNGFKHKLRQSIIAMLEMSLFGIPHTGANMYGFDNTDGFNLGAFFPLSLFFSYDDDDDVSQTDPAQLNPNWILLRKRYTLLPYIYTLFYNAHVNGDTVARPLFHEFTTDKSTWDIDTQFMLGRALLIAPCLEVSGTGAFKIYLPQGMWHNVVDDSTVINNCKGPDADFSPERSHIAFQRGGSVLPRHYADIVKPTEHWRRLRLTLDVLFDCQNIASGSLFWDNGESNDTVESGAYLLISYTARYNERKATFSARISHNSTDPDPAADEPPYYKSVYFYFDWLLDNPRPPTSCCVQYCQEECKNETCNDSKEHDGEILLPDGKIKLNQAFDIDVTWPSD